MIIALRKRIAFVLTLLLVSCDTNYEVSKNKYRSNLDVDYS